MTKEEQKAIEAAALHYARIDLKVIPVNQNKTPRTAHGSKDASNDPSLISKWFYPCANANVAIVTGKINNLVVIDLDIDDEKGLNGKDVLEAWENEHEQLPDTLTSITGRGGYHMLYRMTEKYYGYRNAQMKDLNGKSLGVDIRGEGGYFVVAPSVHENGQTYEWEAGSIAGEDVDLSDIAEVNQAVDALITYVYAHTGKVVESSGEEKQRFEMPEQIGDCTRTDTLVKYIGKCIGQGTMTNEEIESAVRTLNESRTLNCTDGPLSENELQKQVFPAIQRFRENSNKTKAVCDNGGSRPLENYNLEITALNDIQEKEAEWLIPEYIPKGQITCLVGDGGSGKTTLWCSLVAGISSGGRTILEASLPNEWVDRDPATVLCFSSEDSLESVLIRRMRINGANLSNIYSINISDDRFRDVKFNSLFFERLIDKYRPDLCVFDPIQAFIPEKMDMGKRNSMRQCTTPLIGYGEKYGTTFLIVVHTNKQAGVWGRKRMADSSDLWDASRSVLMVGETEDKEIRYLSHEKSNYGKPGRTVLFTVNDEIAEFREYSSKKDKDFVGDATFTKQQTRQVPAMNEAIQFILETLADEEKGMDVSELDAAAVAMGISKNAMKNAKKELKDTGKMKLTPQTSGHSRGMRWFASLLPTQ